MGGVVRGAAPVVGTWRTGGISRRPGESHADDEHLALLLRCSRHRFERYGLRRGPCPGSTLGTSDPTQDPECNVLGCVCDAHAARCGGTDRGRVVRSSVVADLSGRRAPLRRHRRSRPASADCEMRDQRADATLKSQALSANRCCAPDRSLQDPHSPRRTNTAAGSPDSSARTWPLDTFQSIGLQRAADPAR